MNTRKKQAWRIMSTPNTCMVVGLRGLVGLENDLISYSYFNRSRCGNGHVMGEGLFDNVLLFCDWQQLHLQIIIYPGSSSQRQLALVRQLVFTYILLNLYQAFSVSSFSFKIVLASVRSRQELFTLNYCPHFCFPKSPVLTPQQSH